MKTTMLVLIGMMVSATAYAQAPPPPTVGDQPLVQVRPRGAKGAPKAAAKQAASKQSAGGMASKLQACLEVEDESKERLDCYDAVIVPKPLTGKRKAPPPKAVTECRIIKEQDERLACFNGFVSKLPKT